RCAPEGYRERAAALTTDRLDIQRNNWPGSPEAADEPRPIQAGGPWLDRAAVGRKGRNVQARWSGARRLDERSVRFPGQRAWPQPHPASAEPQWAEAPAPFRFPRMG